MHVCIAIDSVIPPVLYGGAERVVFWLGRALHALGHRVSFLARQGSQCDFAQILVIDHTLPIDLQIPPDTDIVHVHSESLTPQSHPFCQTVHGNVRHSRTFHPNSIFVSRSHAANHGGAAFVHNGLAPSDYGPPDLTRMGENFVFLAKAAWRVKNVRGAIRVAHRAKAPIDVLGGNRLNFKMGFRFTLDANARFHGMVGGEEKNAYMRRSRGLIFPVLWEEPFGVAVIEALYFGMPVFATNYGALPELVDESVGVLANNEFDLAEGAARAQSYDRRAIHDWWQKNFTHHHMAKKYLMYYEKILSGENLHSALIQAPSVRSKHLLAWKR